MLYGDHCHSIPKEEEVIDPIKEKGIGSLTIDPKQTKTILKYIQQIGNRTNK
jgi:hypothetical protein